MNHIQHAVADSGAQVEHLATQAGNDVFHRRHVSLGQIHHMDVIPDAGAVGGRIVVAVDTELLPAADGHLGDVGHQVVGNAPGVFADHAAFVGADGVEVAQKHNAPFLVGESHAGEDLLGHVLCPAVGVGAVAGAAGFPQGHLVVAGVDGSRGRENDLLAAHVRHDLGQNQRGIEVIVVVTPRLGDGFSHGLQAREVDDGGNLIFRENFPQERLVPYVSLVEFDFPAGNGLHPLQALGVGVAQVVDDRHIVSAVEKFNAGMGADVSGAAGDQNVHCGILLYTAQKRVICI